jgi:hypothetical protein
MQTCAAASRCSRQSSSSGRRPSNNSSSNSSSRQPRQTRMTTSQRYVAIDLDASSADMHITGRQPINYGQPCWCVRGGDSKRNACASVSSCAC